MDHDQEAEYLAGDATRNAGQPGYLLRITDCADLFGDGVRRVLSGTATSGLSGQRCMIDCRGVVAFRSRDSRSACDTDRLEVSTRE